MDFRNSGQTPTSTFKKPCSVTKSTVRYEQMTTPHTNLADFLTADVSCQPSRSTGEYQTLNIGHQLTITESGPEYTDSILELVDSNPDSSIHHARIDDNRPL